MYTQFQRFVATLLLFSILLQSCGNPNWQMVEADSPAASGKTSTPSKVKKRAPAKLLQVQDGSSEGTIAPKVDLQAEVANALTAGLPVEASHAPAPTPPQHLYSSNPPRPSRSAVPPGVSPTTPLCTSTNSPAQVVRSLPQLKASPKQGDKKPRHIVLDRALVAQRVQHEDRQASARSHPWHVLSPTSVPQLSLAPEDVAPAAHTDLKPSTGNTVHQASSCAVLPSPPTHTYPSAQGHQVCFQEQEGTWMAQVQDGWGRMQELPVICAPDRTPECALQQLSSKALGQHKYWVHVLETHQPPWAPKCVYIGAMGLRGGGQVGSAIREIGRATWGWLSLPFNILMYCAFKDEIPPLPCRVTALPKRDEADLHDSEVDNSCKAAGEWVTFHKDGGGYWYATTSKGNIPVKANRSVSLSLEDLVNSRFSFHKVRKKSFEGCVTYTFKDYDDYEGLSYELELITSPEEVQTNKEARRRQRREAKRREEERRKQEEALRREEVRRVREEERRKQEEALRREEVRRVREEAQKQQELEQKKEVDRAALVGAVSEAVSANFYTSLNQADSLSETHAAQRHSMVQSLGQGLTQNQSRILEHEVIKDGYLSDDELDYDLADNTGSGLDFGPTDDHLPIVEPGEEMGAEENKEEVPSSPEALAERLLHKQQCAQAYDKQERDLQRTFHMMLREVSGYLAEWQNIVSEDAPAPSVQSHLQDFHQTLLALPGALSDWDKSLQNWKKALDAWASSLHQPTSSSWNVDLDLGDYQDMLSHYQAAEKVLTDEQGSYQALLQEVVTFLGTPHYYTALTAPQLQQQAMSLAQTLVQVANDSAVTQAHALQKAEQASKIAQAREEKVQDQLASVHKKLVRKQVVVMAHTLDHKPLLDYLAGKGRKYINEKSAQGKTALQHAVARNEPDIVHWLLDHGAALEAKDEDGLTPLHWAAKQGHTVIVELLLDRGAAIEARNNRASTPLHWAALQGHAATVELLLARDAAIEAQNQWLFTPLYLAAHHAATVELLLARGAATEARNNWASTPLHWAAKQGHAATVELLLDHGAAREAKDGNGLTPLYWAAKQGHTVIAELLLLKAKNTCGKTPDTVAKSKGHQLEDTSRKALEVAPGNVNVVDGEVPQTLQVPVQPANTSLAASSASSQQRRKGSPALAQAKAALRSTLDIHKAAQETAAAAAQALQEAQVAKEHARCQSEASMLHLQTMQQHVVRLTDPPPAPRCVAFYLQDSVKEARDYLYTLPEIDEVVSEAQRQRGNRLLATLYARLQQEQQHYRHADQLFLCDATLSEYAQTQLLGEVLPQYQCHIDTLNDLIGKFVETRHAVTSSDFVLTPHRATDDRSVKSAPVGGHAAWQRRDKQSTSTQSALVKRYATRWNQVDDDDSSQDESDIIDRYARLRIKAKRLILKNSQSSPDSTLLSASLGLSSDSEESSDNPSVGTEAQSTNEEHATESFHSSCSRKGKSVILDGIELLEKHSGEANTAASAQGAPVRGHTEESRKSDSDSSNEHHRVCLGNFIAQQRQQEESQGESYSLSISSKASIGSSELSKKEESSHNASVGTEAQSTNEEHATEESGSQEETRQQAGVLRKREEEFRRREVESEAEVLRALRSRMNLPHNVALSSRIVQLRTTLPASLQENFQKNITPILQEKLLQAPPAQQDKVFHYFQKQGAFYPKVLRWYPVQDWVFMSLFHDLAQGIPPSDASHTRFATLAAKLQEQYPADVLTAVLWELKNEEMAHALSPDELCDVMDMLPEEGADAQALLHLPPSQWRAVLKKIWCRQSIEGCCPHLNMVQRQHLIQELSHLDWSLQATQTLLQQLPQDHNPEELSRLLAFTAQHPIDDALLLEILATPTPAQDNAITHWHHQLACSLLEDNLSKLLPQEIQESTYALIENIWAHTPAYRSINSLLEQLFLKKLQEDGFALNAEHLHLVLAMVKDYRLDDATCTTLLQQLVGLPSHQWQQHFYTQILQHCFAEEAHERTVPEMIEYMAAHSPEVAYVQDQVAFEQAHRAILEAYQAASKVLPGKQAIASWDAATITQWAQTIKDYAQNPGKGALPTQSELIAVVKRAVELCYRFPPRNTQLLSLLVLLNPTPGQGRLVQINTGEGKSLTVAMFSAIQALLNNKSDIVTTSTELSIPEVAKQRPFFEMLALTVAENSAKGTQDSNDKKKQQAYQQDNVYGAPADFQGDILRGEFFGKELRMQRPFDCVVVDEVDNMLFDSRSHSIRLSSTMPATNHLEILLAATWQRVKYMSSHLVKDQDQIYCIEEDFQKDENGHITILSGEERDPEKCMRPIEGTVEDFIQERVQQRLQLLLRDLDSDEKEAYQASRKLEQKIAVLRTDLANEKNSDRHKAKEDQLEQLEEEHKALPWNADRTKYPPIVSVPAHLKDLAKQQVPRWIQNAITAALVYKKGHHYDVHDGKIVPVDYDNTGVWQHNMVWSNGLAQFLQIKEGLKVSPENISTNFISTVGFFQRYAKQLYGLTGTLGNEVTQEFFRKVYHTDLVIVPPYKQRLIVGNVDSRYACKELTPQLIVDKDTNKWYDAIEASALQHAQQQRAVLIICKYICQVHALEARLQGRYAKDKIFTYTGKKKFEKDKVYPGEIIIATNIAGRGTDLTPSELVEHHGGLHVCITFLPESYRVEIQNAGRTARQGSKGTTQLILHQPEATSIEALRQQRDEQEVKDLQQAIDEVKNMTFKDELFQRFCQAENKLLPTLDGFKRLRHSELLEQAWAIYAQDALAPEALRNRYEKHIDHLVQTGFDAIPSTQCNSLSHQEKQAQKENAIKKGRTDNPFEEFQKAYTLIKRREAIQEIQTELGSNALHPDVVKAFEEGRKYVPENGELAVKYGWGPHERKAVEERFGLWFHQHIPQKKEPINFETTRAAFESFLQAIEKDAKANNLIHNAFFYVQKGNYLLQSSGSRAAMAAYDKAIALDPDFSLHARYNKAMALLTPEENKHNHTEAKKELREAKILIERYKNDLFIFQSIIGYVQPPKPQTAQHLQHHLDILFQQDHHIDAAIGVIEEAQNARKNKGNHVKFTKSTEVDALFDQDAAQEHREQALAESYENGLSVFFTIEEKIPKPWLSICAVALIGLVQIATAVLATIGTAGMMTAQLLKSGISDLITAISSAISGKFSWKEWGISKAISIGVSIISAGISECWSSVSKGFEELREGVQKGISEIKMGASAVKDALMSQVKKVAVEVGKGVGLECINILLNQGVQEIAGEAIAEKITNQVSQEIMRSMLKSDFIKRAMAHDIAKGRDYWGQIFIKEGLAMLNEKDSAWYTMLKGIIQGTALQQLTKHIQELYGEGNSKTAILSTLASVGLPLLSGFLTDINGFTDTFLENFHARLEQKYEQELAKMEATISATQQPTETATEETQAPAEQEFMHVLDAQVHFDDDELQLHDLNNGQAFSTQAKVTPQQAAIAPKSSQEDRARALGNALTGNISAHLLGKVNQHLISPLTSLAAGAFMDFATSGITEHFRKERNRAVATHRVYREENELANTHEAEGQAAKKIDASTLKDQREANKNSEGDMIKLSTYVQETSTCCEMLDGELNLVYSIGTEYKSDDNPAIQLQHKPHSNATEATDTHGHFQIPNSDIKVTPSGPLNCLEDAFVAQLSESKKKELNIYTGQDLRDRGVAYLAAHPHHAQQSALHYQTLLYHDPAALMRGGGLQNVEMIYAQHQLNGTEPDWAAMGAADIGFATGLLCSLGKQAKNAVVGLAGLPDALLIHLPVALAKRIIKLVEDPQGTVETTLTKIKALPAYVTHAPAAFKEHIDAIQALEDPFEKGQAIGKLMGNVLPASVAVGKVASDLGRWGQVAKAARAKLLPRKNVYQLAKEGIAHGETYKTYLHKPENQLNKGIRSFEKRIAEHRDKVANPKKYHSNWHTLAEDYKQRALKSWKIEIKGFTEAKWIYEGILRDRK